MISILGVLLTAVVCTPSTTTSCIRHAPASAVAVQALEDVQVERPRSTARHIDESALFVAQESLVLDMLTTLQIKTYYWRMHETNPLLGEHPGDAKVVGYFAACAVLTGTLWRVLPPKTRPLLYVLAAVEGYWFLHNSLDLNANHAWALQGYTNVRSPYRQVKVVGLGPERTFTLAFQF